EDHERADAQHTSTTTIDRLHAAPPKKNTRGCEFVYHQPRFRTRIFVGSCRESCTAGHERLLRAKTRMTVSTGSWRRGGAREALASRIRPGIDRQCFRKEGCRLVTVAGRQLEQRQVGIGGT